MKLVNEIKVVKSIDLKFHMIQSCLNNMVDAIWACRTTDKKHHKSPLKYILGCYSTPCIYKIVYIFHVLHLQYDRMTDY